MVAKSTVVCMLAFSVSLCTLIDSSDVEKAAASPVNIRGENVYEVAS